MESLAEDRLEGAAAIAEFYYGDPKLKHRIYYYAKRGLPVFYQGATICASKARLRQHQLGEVAA